MRYDRHVSDEFKGLQLGYDRIHIPRGGAQIDVNGDRRLMGAWRARAGYARLVSDALLYEEADVVSFDLDTLSSGDELQDEAEWTGYGVNASNIVETAGGVMTYELADPATAAAVGYTGTSFQDDQFAEAVIGAMGTNEHGGPAVRINSTDCYVLSPEDGDPNDLVVYRFTMAGARELVAVIDAGTTVTTDDVIRLEVRGSELTVLRNGTVLGSTVDDSISTGVPGFAFQNQATSSVGLDPPAYYGDFGAGSLKSRKTPIEVSGLPSRLFAFERDDDQSKIMVAYARAMDAFDVGGPEWT